LKVWHISGPLVAGKEVVCTVISYMTTRYLFIH